MRLHATVLALALTATAAPALAAEEQYAIDDGHTFVTFEISHIGFAWIPGTFNQMSGSFTYDPENRSNSSAEFTVMTKSLDTNHAKRDKHLRGEDFFNVSEYPEATFESTSYEPTGENTAVLKGDLTIKGTTRPVELQVTEMAAREDPWGNFRRAFQATTEISLDAFNVDEYGLGEASSTAELRIAVEGLRQ
jgi:polyisoprenoid-binding protein YceI